jgi:hypothetical protein
LGKVNTPPPVKLICGFIFSGPEVIQQAVQRLQVQLGPIDVQSEIFLFSHTEYYRKEMGQGLGRLFVSFSRLIRRERLAEVKLLTNGLEENLSRTLKGQNRRQVNIDPGYLEASKLVLASTKNFSHRIYLSRGIYAEVTLQYRQNRFQPLPWTYPDYQSPQVLSFLQRARRVYLEQVR